MQYDPPKAHFIKFKSHEISSVLNICSEVECHGFVVFSNIIIIVYLQNDCYDYGWYVYVHDYPLRTMDLGFLR